MCKARFISLVYSTFFFTIPYSGSKIETPCFIISKIERVIFSTNLHYFINAIISHSNSHRIRSIRLQKNISIFKSAFTITVSIIKFRNITFQNIKKCQYYFYLYQADIVMVVENFQISYPFYFRIVGHFQQLLPNTKVHHIKSVKKSFISFGDPKFFQSFEFFALRPPSREFVERLLVQGLVGVLGAHREEYVPADEFMHHLAVGRLHGEYDVALLELHHHVFYFPVYVPCL